MNTLGQNIKAARVAAGLTQEKLAEKVVISSSSLSHYENDRDMPSPQTLKLIAEALQTTVDELTNPEGETGKERKRIQKKQKTFQRSMKRAGCCFVASGKQ